MFTASGLAQNWLKEIPSDIALLTNLEAELNLEMNSFTVLPSEFARLTKLKRLSFGENFLTAIPREYTLLTNLELEPERNEFILDGNFLDCDEARKSLPPSIRDAPEICKKQYSLSDGHIHRRAFMLLRSFRLYVLEMWL